MIYSLFGITLPAATTAIAEMGEYSSAWFDEVLPAVYVMVGIMLGIFILIIIKNAFMSFLDRE